MTWNTDWSNAPKEHHFLVKYTENDVVLVTTGAFFWETATAEIDGYSGAWWALHDMVRDQPLDEAGPPEDNGLEWMEIP